jgi:predicted ATPase
VYISEFQLNNYKSYYDSAPLKLLPGVNIVVGQNHAGKTALLEGLSLSFPSNPHRNSKIKRRVDQKGSSWAAVSFTLGRSELFELLEELPDTFAIPLPSKEKMINLEMMPEIQHVMRFLDAFLAAEEFTFEVRVGSGEDGNRISHIKFPACAAYTADGYTDKRSYAFCTITDNGKVFTHHTQENSPASFDFGLKVAEILKGRVYSFRAERQAARSVKTGLNTRLKPDASNLAEVLENLQGQNPGKFRMLNGYLRDIFPQVHEISVRPDLNHTLNREVVVYEEESLNAVDAVPLSDSGTGIGQVLSMLYVLVASEDPQVMVIDEPQSFLHPGAVRKLFEIFAAHPQHQYIVSTHIPNVIAAANPTSIILVRKEKGRESTFRIIDKDDTEDLRLALHEVGARLSDVFGADYILWVEGPTERECFPLILQKLRPKRLKGTEFVPVLSTDEVLGKHADRVMLIYERLSSGRGLLPPAIGFIFDRECRKADELDRLERHAGRTVKFIGWRMYENYLLNPNAIAAVLSGSPGMNEGQISSADIETWLSQEIEKQEYYCQKPPAREPWVQHVDGARLLDNLFSTFSGATLSYSDRKIDYGLKLTKWILENEPEKLQELADLIHNLLPE